MYYRALFVLLFIQAALLAQPADKPEGTPTVTDDDVIGFWLFNEGTGSTAADLSTYGDDGTLTGGASWATGPCISFDGTDDYVDVGDQDQFDGLTNFSVVAWFYWDTPAVSDWYTIFSKCNESSASTGQCMVSLVTYSDAYEKIDLTACLADNTFFGTVSDWFTPGTISGDWAMIAVVLDGTNAVIYLNGTSVRSTARSGAMQSSAAPIRIGASLNGSSLSHPFKGKIDHVVALDRALSSSEVSSLYSDPWQYLDTGDPAVDPTVYHIDGIINGTIDGVIQ